MTVYIGRTRARELVADVPAGTIGARNGIIEIDGVIAVVIKTGKPFDESGERRQYVYLDEATAIGLQPKHNRPVSWNKPKRPLPGGVRKSGA